jgi:hypothetical protein
MMNSLAVAILAASIATAAPTQQRVVSGAGPGLKAATTSVVNQLADARIPAQATRRPPARLAPRHSVGRQIIGGVLGAGVGFFAGIFVGGAIENQFVPCHCDDPGLKGAVIGAPIGAVAGAIFGAIVSRD